MRKYLIILLYTLYIIPALAQSPKWLKKVKAAQVTIMVYNRNGDMTETQGVLADDRGTILTEYDALKHAARAVVVDAGGKEYPVKEVLGANAMYNVAKLQMDWQKGKLTFLQPSDSQSQVQDPVYILPYAKAGKNAECTEGTVVKVDTFRNNFNFYTIDNPKNERLKNCAVLNGKGEMIGLLQTGAREDLHAYVIDSRFITSLKIRPMDAGNNDLKAIYIRKALPEKEEDALTYLYLLDKRDSTNYTGCMDDFVQRYPKNSSGRILKAEYMIENGNYREADRLYEEALNTEGISKDEIYFSKARAIYALNLNRSYQKYSDWDMEKSLTEVRNASSINPLPIYTQQEANCLFVLKRYEEAQQKFLALAGTNLRSADIFLNAAQCNIVQNKEEGVLELLDSALACYSTPYPAAAANLILIRANELAKAGKNRDAVIGMLDYERLAGGNLNANFYYKRQQLGIKARMYSQALSDIEKTIALEPKEPLYYAEAAALNYRVAKLDDAIEYARKAIEIDNTFADAYRIMGVCYSQKGNKAEARKYLQKAIDLGDTLAAGIINEMK